MEVVARDRSSAQCLAVHGCAPPSPLESHARFELVARLGEGAHGEVFEAFDRLRGTRIALKALRHSSPQQILRFKREFRALAQIHHPNLIEFGELFEHAGRWFFSMELIEGVDFVRFVRADADDGTLTEPISSLAARLNDALVQLGRGLAALHDAGKIHRDVKPGNIRVQADGRVVLLDFGLVTPSEAESAAETEQVVGTVGYMAPEQAAGRPLSPAADAYAVGVLLYEALTGELPFRGTPLEVLIAKQSRSVEIAPERTASLPAELVQLCHELCRLDPAQRPSAAEWVARLGGCRALARAGVDSGADDRRMPRVSCVGRDRELALLEGAFESARAGALSKVRIHGASGVGKSALLRAFREQPGRRDGTILVLSGRCDEQERVAYKAFDAAIDELGSKLEQLPHELCARLVPKHVAALASVFPVLGRLAAMGDGPSQVLPPDPITLRLHAYTALRDLLHRLAERAPLVLMLDDLQWADEESLELLWALIRPPDPPPLLLMAAHWPLEDCTPEVRANLERAFGSDTLQLELGALSRSAAAQLARQLLQASSGVAPERLAAAAGCQPLFIEVLARATGREQNPGCELDQALRFEARALSDAAQHVLQLLVVAGTAIAERALADAADLPADAFAQALAELRHARCARLRESAGEFAVTLYHARIRAALLADLDEARQQQHHLSLARALARSACRDPGALAIHWLRAGQPGAAAACFTQAAEIAERAQAFGHAAELYRSALAALPAACASERSSQLHKLAAALAHAGRSSEAARAFASAADGCEGELARERLQLAAEQFLRAGEVESGMAIARSLLLEFGERLPAGMSGGLIGAAWARAQLSLRGTQVRERRVEDQADEDRHACDLLWSFGVPLTSLDLVLGVDLHTRCLLRALRLGDPARIARSLALEALYMRVGTADQELRVRGTLAMADNLARRVGDPYLKAFSQLCHSTYHLLIGEPALALATADAAALQLEDECRNVAWEIGGARAAALSALSYLGRFRELRTRFDAAVEDAEARGNLNTFTTLVTLNRCTIDLVADRPDACRASLERVMQTCPAQWHLQHTFAFGAHVLLDLYAGGDAAHRRLEQGWHQLRHRLILNCDRFRIFFLYVRGLAALSALIADGDDVRSRVRLVRASVAALGRERILDATAGAHMLRGQLACYHGEHSVAVSEYRAAAELWGRVGMYGYHVANVRLGELLGGAEGAALIAGCMVWAQSEGIQCPERFFRICGPVTRR